MTGCSAGVGGRPIDRRGSVADIDPSPPPSVCVCVWRGVASMVHSALVSGPMSHRPDSILGIPKSPSFHSGLDLVSGQTLPAQLPSLLGQCISLTT